jgi:hypothetical protein
MAMDADGDGVRFRCTLIEDPRLRLWVVETTTGVACLCRFVAPCRNA